MSVNSSSSMNMYEILHSCLTSKDGILSITAFTITSVFILLPLYFLVLYLGLQQWRQQRSGTTISHSDLFTYHMIFGELLSVLGCTLCVCAVNSDVPQMMMLVGMNLLSMNLSGQMLFHVLTCVERYLAVVHPITYLSLRKAKGIRIRNITIGCAWLLCFAGVSFLYMKDTSSLAIASICGIANILIVSFCSLSVLCVLIRPGPGERGGGRQQVEQSKLRAFYTIMAILGVLVFRFGSYILSTALYAGLEVVGCGLLVSVVWFGLPSSLVLPLLFLHRAGKLPCCKNNK